MVAESLGAQHLPKVRFAFDAHGRGSWRVQELELCEEIGAPYHCDLDLVSVDSGADVPGLLGATVTLEILRGDLVRRIHGVIFRVIDQGTAHDHVSVHVHMAPALWLASYGTNTRIFQGRTAPQIIQEVLKEPLWVNHRLCETRLDYEHYIAREFCVQYQESDLEFAHRLMQEEGISYFFDQSGEYKRGQYEKLVLVDCNEAFPRCETLDHKAVPVAAHGAVAGYVETLHSLSASREMGTNRAVVHDFDWTRSHFHFSNTLEKKEGDGPEIEIYDHAPFHMVSEYSHDEARYTDDERHIKQRARIRLEEAQARQKLCTGSSNVTGLAAGMLLEAVARGDSDLDGEYLVCGVRHVGHSDEDLAESEQARASREVDFRNSFECIPAAVPYRPKRSIQHPVVQGLVTATVVGPAGKEVETDGYGRVKVQFHWDRHGKRDVNSSCWVRVAQAWAGPGYGTMFIPRIGMEVVVQFIEGDPDRPLIIGSVYNGGNAPAYGLPGGKTKSWIRTASSPKGDHRGYNEIRFEDRRGEEEVYIHAQQDMKEEIVRNHDLAVGGNQLVKVKGAQTELVEADRLSMVTGSQMTNIERDSFDRIAGTRRLFVFGANLEVIEGSETRSLVASQTTRIGGSHELYVDGSFSTHVGSEDRPAEAVVSVTGRYTLDATERIQVASPTELVLKCGESRVVIGPKSIRLETDHLSLVGRESVALKAKGPEILATDVMETSAKTINFFSENASLELAAKADLNGKEVNINCGGGSAQKKSEEGQEAKTKTLKKQLHDADMKPFANKRYRLVVSGLRLEGTTDGSGLVKEEVPEDARLGHLTLWLADYPTGPRLHWPIEFVDEPMPDATSPKGALARLQALGYFDGKADAGMTPAARNALREFQGDYELEPSGELDGQTSAKLKEIHGA